MKCTSFKWSKLFSANKNITVDFAMHVKAKEGNFKSNFYLPNQFYPHSNIFLSLETVLAFPSVPQQ